MGLFELALHIVARGIPRVTTSNELEKDLNDSIVGETWTIETFEGDSVVLRVSSIQVRPLDRLMGNDEPEIWIKDPDGPTFRDRIWSIWSNNWMTTIQFKVADGHMKDVIPAGLGIGYVSSHSVTGLAYHLGDEPVPHQRMIRFSRDSKIEKGKLETKVKFSSHGEYREEIEKIPETLEFIHDNIEELAIDNLSLLYNHKEETWRHEETAEMLVKSIFGPDIPIERVEKALLYQIELFEELDE